MLVNQLYHTWFHWIKQLRPEERVTRLGLRLVERSLTNALPVSVRLQPVYGCKLPGG